jgi:hypothetical protein
LRLPEGGRFEGTAGVGSSPAPKTEKEAARVGIREREEEERGRRKESGGVRRLVHADQLDV